MRLLKTAIVGLILGVGASAIAWAQADPGGRPAYSPAKDTVAPLLGSWGDINGSRSFLASRGVTYNFTYTGEVLGNPTGGMKRGSVYQGLIQFSLDADLERLAGWKGAAIHLNSYNIQGREMSDKFIGNQMTVSTIEAKPTVRLDEFWFEQTFLDDKAALRVGQLGADTDFWNSNYAGLFINGTFGWPDIAGVNLPSGGPAYPLATPGVRLKVMPSDNLTLLAAVFNGNPAGNRCSRNRSPQLCNAYGMPRLGDGTFTMLEADYAYNQGKDAPGLPGTIKFGAWYNSNKFSSMRYADGRVPIADPDSNGEARDSRGNWGLYGVLDQAVYKVPGTDGTIGVFTRVGISPGDRNEVDLYVDAGLNASGVIASRPNDTFGIAFAYAEISRDARMADRDAYIFTGSAIPTRRFEGVVEVTYQAQIAPGWIIQPDIQYVFNPGGRILNKYDFTGTKVIKNALILGLRTTINY